MSVSINDLSISDQVKKLIVEGSQFMPHREQEREVVVAMMSENYKEDMITGILTTYNVGATIRKMTTGYKCPSACTCGGMTTLQEYLAALYAECHTAKASMDEEEIESIEKELGFTVDKVTIFESTETSIKFEISVDGQPRDFMIEPERMYLPHEFARAVLGSVQVVMNVPARKRWPLLLKKWLAHAERVCTRDQTTTGIIADNLKEYIRSTGLEATRESGAEELTRGNCPVLEIDEGWLVYIKIGSFLDYLDRNKVKVMKTANDVINAQYIRTQYQGTPSNSHNQVTLVTAQTR